MIDIFERIKANNPWWGQSNIIEGDSLIKEFKEQKFRYFHPLINQFASFK